MSRDAEHEARGSGHTVGEARWRALKELQGRFPGLTAEDVDFVDVAGEGESTDEIAVLGRAQLERWRSHQTEDDGSAVERVRGVVERIVAQAGVRASVEIVESEDEIAATVNGSELGLLIGKKGQTVEAIEHLAMRAALAAGGDKKRVVVDVAGYRERREASLRRAAERAASDAMASGRPVSLDPMAASERRTIHMLLRERPEIETYSEGQEPERRLVVAPRRLSAS